MNIVYRIVNCILAIAVFPALFFLKLFYMEISPSFLDYGMSVEISFYDIFQITGGNSISGSTAESVASMFSKDSLSNFWSVFAPARVRLVLAIIFFVIAIIGAIFIFVYSIVKGGKKTLLISGSAGLVSTILFMIFTSSVMKEVVSGEISIIKLFSQGFIGGLISTVINVDTLTLGSFANGILILYICLVMWSVIYMVTDIGLTDEKAAAAPAKKKKK